MISPKLSPSELELNAQRYYLQALARNLLPDHRVNCCLRRVVPNKRSVEIWRSATKGRAHYRNLVTCSCVWICPVCAAKISERRREEIKRVVSAAQDIGVRPILATYTMAHQRGETLNVTLTDITSAYAAMTSGGGWQLIKDENSIIGYIRTFEMTHGSNGWHPHIHVLLLADCNPDKISRDLEDRWLRTLATIGRDGRQGIACDVRVSNDAIADYITKFGHEPVDPEKTKAHYWSMEQELAKSINKKATKGNRNPFEILACTGVTSDTQSRVLFREYATTTKGKRQLEWSRSPNLHRLAGVPEITDQEIMQLHDQDAYLLAKLSMEQWHIVLRNAAVATLIDLAGKGDITDLIVFLEDIGAGNPFTGVDVS